MDINNQSWISTIIGFIRPIWSVPNARRWWRLGTPPPPEIGKRWVCYCGLGFMRFWLSIKKKKQKKTTNRKCTWLALNHEKLCEKYKYGPNARSWRVALCKLNIFSWFVCDDVMFACLCVWWWCKMHYRPSSFHKSSDVPNDPSFSSHAATFVSLNCLNLQNTNNITNMFFDIQFIQ